MTSSGCFEELFKCFHVAVRGVWSSFRGGSSCRRGPHSEGSAAPSSRRIRGLEPPRHVPGDGALPQYCLGICATIRGHRGAQRGTFRQQQNLRYEFFAGRLTSQVGHCSFRQLLETLIFVSPRHDRLVLRLPLSGRGIKLRRWTPVAIPKADDPSKLQPLIRVRDAA